MTTTVVSRQVRINHPGDGEWLMDRVGGTFRPGHDNTFMTHRAGTPLGGLVTSGYLHASIQFHMAGDDRRWITRDLLWLAFDFAFNQLACHKVIAPVPSTNTEAMAIDLRAGFEFEAVIRGAVPGGDLVLLTMTRDKCRWLKHRCNAWRRGSDHG